MTVDIVIRGGTIVTPDQSFRADLAIDEGKIVGIGTQSIMPNSEKTIDADGLFVLPGIIDSHVHFREPGLEYKEDLHTGSMAAAAGGVTTFLDMPNVNPPTQDATSFRIKLQLAKSKSIVNFGIYGVVLPTNIDRIKELANEGAVGYKIFMGETVGNLPSPDDWELILAFREIAKTGLRVGVHAENRSITTHLVNEMKARGRTDPVAHLESRPSISEMEAVTRALLFSKEPNTKLHIFHVSAKDTVPILKYAKGEGRDVTAETCPHYLLFDGEQGIRELGPLLKMNPPVRNRSNAEGLWEGLKSGAIDMVATDHSPHTRDEKFKSSIWEAVAGWPGVETSLPLMLNEVNNGRLALNQLVRYMCENPAKAWGLHHSKGVLGIGYDADVTIVDLKATKKIQAEELHSKNKFTPFDGWVVKGLPVHTIVDGHHVMSHGQIIEDAAKGKLTVPKW